MLSPVFLSTKEKKVQTLSEIHKSKIEEKERIKNPQNNIYTNEVLKDIASIIKSSSLLLK